MQSSFSLPWPPTNNTYFTVARGRKIKSAEARAYCATVATWMMVERVPYFPGKVGVEIDVYPPDRRMRDLDNLLKGPLDAICRAGRIADDSNVDEIIMRRRTVEKEGRLFVRIYEIGVDGMDTA